MCLLAVAFHAHPESPLIVAANRDEVLSRPSAPMTILDPGPPLIVGGRDLLAGGTWLAINENGLIAGLTNLPSAGGRDPRRRTRGELPLALARHTTARVAADAFPALFSPRDYNPAWLVTGDRDALFYIDMTGDSVQVTELTSGLYVLENRPLSAASPKAALVHRRFAEAMSQSGDDLIASLEKMLASHDIPVEATDEVRPPETLAACVHAGSYGTRSSSIIIVPAEPSPPRILFADGPPCTTTYTEFKASPPSIRMVSP